MFSPILLADDTPLHLYPSSGPMFGGNPIEVSEACFKPDQEIKCQFGDQVHPDSRYNFLILTYIIS